MTTISHVAPQDAALPKVKVDVLPLLLVPLLALLMLPLVGSFPTWVTLTIAGLAMGMMIFMMASGLTLIFGLMDVLNFGHGAFVSVGAFTATLVLLPMKSWVEADSVLMNLSVLGLAILLAMLVTGLLGWAFERIIIRPVYGLHLKQILITMGGMIVAEQLIHVIWGAEQIPLQLPTTFRGAFIVGDAALEKYRLIAVGVGLTVFITMFLVLNRTKVGLLIGALLVGLMANYTGFLAPKVALFSNIALMMAVLLWRPQGVYPVANR